MSENNHLPVIAVLSFAGSNSSVLTLLADESTDIVERVSSYFLGAPETPETGFIARLRSAPNLLAAKLAIGETPQELKPSPAPRHFPRLGLIVGTVDPVGLDKLRKDPDVIDVVRAVEPKMVYDVELLDEPAPQRAWSIDYLNIPELWERGLTGKGVVIGHLDSGVDGDHAALKRPLQAFAAIDAEGRATVGGTASDNHGHGTHTAGIICAQSLGGVTVGIAPDVKLCSGQITGDNALMRLLGGLEWLLGQGVRLLSLSAGVEPYNPVFQAIIDRLRASNILPIVSIGNSYAGTSYSPGNYRNALGVGSINQSGDVANSSCSENFGDPPPYSKPDLVAPGVGILSTRRFGGYELRSGTSQAAPCVVGIAALVMQALPHATIAEIEQKIIASCRKLDKVPSDRQGRGVVTPVAALAL